MKTDASSGQIHDRTPSVGAPEWCAAPDVQAAHRQRSARRHNKDRRSSPAGHPGLAAAAFVQAWENVRHIRNERIWFTNAYSAILVGGLALLRVDQASAAPSTPPTIGLIVLILFSVVSLMSSIRLVAELRNSIANVQRIVDENGMGRLVGVIEPPRGFGTSLPMRWVFPIFFFLTTVSLVGLLFVRVLR